MRTCSLGAGFAEDAAGVEVAAAPPAFLPRRCRRVSSAMLGCLGGTRADYERRGRGWVCVREGEGTVDLERNAQPQI